MAIFYQYTNAQGTRINLNLDYAVKIYEHSTEFNIQLEDGTEHVVTDNSEISNLKNAITFCAWHRKQSK